MLFPKKISTLILISMLLLAIGQPLVAEEGKININSGTKQELVSMKYVGDKLADRIIAYRSEHPFESIEDLMKVKGIGKKIFEVNKMLLVVKDEP